MTVDLVIPENPQPIVASMGFAYAIEDHGGEIIAATTVLVKADPKSGGLLVEGIDRAQIAKQLADSILQFAESMGGVAKRVRYMTPDEYAKWSDENDDQIDDEELEEVDLDRDADEVDE